VLTAPDDFGPGDFGPRVYFPALDGVRALAFLMVFSFHYLSLPWGWAGVDVFFVLSGFLITGILFDSREQPCRVRNFYVRRALRIFPLYYGLMLLLVLLYPIFRWQWGWSWLLWPAYLGNFLRGHRVFVPRSAIQMLADAQPLSRTFPNIQLYCGHFWTLCVEEQFYLVWPWVVFGLRDRRRLMAICLGCVAVCPLLRILGAHLLPPYMLDQEVLYRYTPFRVDALLLGGLIALARRGRYAARVLPAARAVFTAMCCALGAWLVWTPAARHGTMHYVYPEWRFTWGLSAIDLLAACVIVMALQPGSLTFRVFHVRPLRWLGRISYGAYVFHDILHFPLMQWVGSRTGHYRLPTAALGLASTLLLAWASFRWFEGPVLRWKDRWAATPVRGDAGRVREEAEFDASAAAV